MDTRMLGHAVQSNGPLRGERRRLSSPGRDAPNRSTLLFRKIPGAPEFESCVQGRYQLRALTLLERDLPGPFGNVGPPPQSEPIANVGNGRWEPPVPPVAGHQKPNALPRASKSLGDLRHRDEVVRLDAEYPQARH